MRLTCPNCRAQYEVPDEVIPPGGREVQCSSCDNTWFQGHPDRAQAKSTEPDVSAATATPADDQAAVPSESPEPPTDTPAPEVSATPVGARSLDPAVAGILQEEAALEAEIRARESDALESQPDLGLDAHIDLKNPPAEDDAAPPAEPEATGSRRDMLPDIEEINSTLRNEVAVPPTEDQTGDQAARKSGGFLRGFALVILLGIALIMIYGNASSIAQSVPQAEPALTTYVSLVDQARVWLEVQVATFMPSP